MIQYKVKHFHRERTTLNQTKVKKKGGKHKQAGCHSFP